MYLQTTFSLLTSTFFAGAEVKFKHAQYPTIICSTNVDELATFEETDENVICGAGVTLNRLDEEMKKCIEVGKGKAFMCLSLYLK